MSETHLHRTILLDFQVGETGVGKSTFIKNMAGSFGWVASRLAQPQQGSVHGRVRTCNAQLKVGRCEASVEYEHDNTIYHFCFEVSQHCYKN